MTSHDEAVRFLVRQLQCPEDLPPEQHRAALERVVLPMIRCALRSGRGAAPLVRWVRRNKPAVPAWAGAEPSLPPDWAAPALCRKFCTLLLEQLESRLAAAGGGRETIAAACETVVRC